ncbi:MAG: DUF2029 domain-containing protein [Chloroflexi bacterium]|nr:DUF2029 domain-containing protein [Chloroflexota bacterium]
MLIWLVAQLLTLLRTGAIVFDDFLAYWTVGRLQLTGRNPYDPELVLVVQQAVGHESNSPLMVWYPPWALAFVLPLGAVDYPLGRLLWLGLQFGTILGAVALAWRYFGGRASDFWQALVITASFVPALFVLKYGQIGPLLLLGLVAFLWFERKQQWWQAGASTLLIAVKPHLLPLFWVALFLWSVDRRKWQLLVGTASALVIATLLVLPFNFQVLSQYLDTAVSYPPYFWVPPNAGRLLRLLFAEDRIWLQFVPTLIGLGGLLWYWRHQRSGWDWSEQLPILILGSLCIAPYGWPFDHVILLPFVLQAALSLRTFVSRFAVILTVGGYFVVDALALLTNVLHFSDSLPIFQYFLAIGLAPLWLLAYFGWHRVWST